MATTAGPAGPITATETDTKQTRVRYFMLFMLFALTVVNYADRSTLSITGTEVAKDLALDAVAMGFVFSAFGWTYAIGQIPGGWLLDRYGSKAVYGLSLLGWSLLTFLQGSSGFFGVALAVYVMFALRFLLGLVESPAFPANGRIVAAWFPTAERGTATAVFNSAQYFATVLFAPIMGWITHALGWQYVFYFMGVIGFILAAVWFKVVYSPKDHPRISPSELDYIERGGALVNMDEKKATTSANTGPQWSDLKQLLTNRMLLGHLHRPVLHHGADLLLHHLVPDLLGQGPRAVHPPGRLCGHYPGHLRLCGWHPGRDALRLPDQAGTLGLIGPQDAFRDRNGAGCGRGGLQLRRTRPQRWWPSWRWPSSARAWRRSAGL